MGIKSSTKTKWVGKGLTLKTVQTLNLGKRIDVDANALAYKMIGKDAGKPIGEILASMALHLKQLAHSGGFVITVIFDGVSRPDCKRASLSRRKERFLNEANRMYCRLKSLQLKAKYEKDRNDDDKKKLEQYTRECQKLEKLCARSLSIPGNVASLLSERLMMFGACSPNENGGYVDENVITAKFQADSLIACRSMSNLSDFIYGNDSDYFVLLGAKCLLMWNMNKVTKRKGAGGRKRKNKKKNDEEDLVCDATQYQVEIYGACNEKMREYQATLSKSNTRMPNKLEWKLAEQQLFQSNDPILRALVALTLGCDVFDGVKDLGIKKIEEKLKKIECDPAASQVSSFKSFMQSKMNNLDLGIIDTLVSAFIYEPGIVDETKRVESSYDATNNEQQLQKYVHSPPPDYSFPRFLEPFSLPRDSTQHEIVDGPPLCYCSGFNGNGRHSYLEFEGSYQCSHCNVTFCKTCTFIPSEDIPKGTKAYPDGRIYYQDADCQKLFCLDCFKAMRYGENMTSSEVTSLPATANVTTSEMRQVLNERVGLQLSASSEISPLELLDIYDMYVSSPSNSRDSIHLEQARQKIRYPLFGTDCIGDKTIFKPIGEEFPFTGGGRFISDPQTVSNDNVCQVLELLTLLLKYDEDIIPNSEQHVNVYFGKYDFLPSIFLHLAFHSRVDSGYRLLDRCARHTCDPKGSSIFFTKASFFEYVTSENKKGTC